MAIKDIGSGWQAGYTWAVDHDDVAGTLGLTVTGAATRPGKLQLHAQVIRTADDVVIFNYGPLEIEQLSGQGRQVLYTNQALVGIALNTQPPGAYYLNTWTTYG